MPSCLVNPLKKQIKQNQTILLSHLSCISMYNKSTITETRNQANRQVFNFILTKCDENYVQCRSMTKRNNMLNFTEVISMDGCKTKEKALFNIFAKDIPITKQEIVLQKRNVMITTGFHKIYNFSKCFSLVFQNSICTLSSRTTLVPPYSGKRTFSPTFTLTGCTCPFCKTSYNSIKPHFSRTKKKHFLVDYRWVITWVTEPGPIATTVACRTFP